MWLCQFDDCRTLGDHGYMEAAKRLHYAERLKRELGHDLLTIIAANRQIGQRQIHFLRDVNYTSLLVA
jgi:hypothetical protein